MHFAHVNGIRLAYDRRGSGAPLLLVHGFPLDSTTWQELVPLLAAQFDVIIPDLRGFGQSDAPGGAYTIAQMADDLSALLDELGIEKTYLVGHSMGGYISLGFLRANPKRILGLGLVGSQAAPDTAERKTIRYAQAEKALADGVGFLAADMSPKLSANSDHTPFFSEAISRQRSEGVAGALQAMAERPDSLDLFPGFAASLVLVHGLADTLIPSERAREILEKKPDALLVELLGVGHSPAVEAPAETAAALRHGFLGG